MPCELNYCALEVCEIHAVTGHGPRRALARSLLMHGRLVSELIHTYSSGFARV
jgi:hypothetical protein